MTPNELIKILNDNFSHDELDSFLIQGNKFGNIILFDENGNYISFIDVRENKWYSPYEGEEE